MKKIKIILLGAITVALSACNGFFDKDNTPPPSPLVKFRPEAKLLTIWQTRTRGGSDSEYLKLVPAVTDRAIFTAGKNGSVTATDKITGRNIWQINTNAPISGGPSANNNIVVIGSRDGDVIALDQLNGKTLWKTKVSSEVLAAPGIAEGVVLVKTIDGKLSALSTQDGRSLWRYEEVEPSLILRGASAPQIRNGQVVVGFANGSLSKLTLSEGSQHWHQPIATPEGSFAIQRMIDIDADPIIMNNRVYAATYQGRVTSLEMGSGKQLWTHDISSYTGITADSNKVYVSDAKSNLWAFDANSGNVFWRQNQLEFRNISGPAVIGNYIVVGDAQGYLHLMNKQDGHFVARVKVDSSGILAAPVVNNNTIYVFTKDGRLAAYTLG